MCGLIRWKDYRKSLCHSDSLKRNHRSKFIAAKYTTFKTSSSAAINHGCWGIWWQRLNCCKGYCCASDSCNCHQIVCRLLTGQKCCPAFTMGGSVTAAGEAVCAMVTTSNTLPDRLLWVVIFYSVAEDWRSACRSNKKETVGPQPHSTVSSWEHGLRGILSLLFSTQSTFPVLTAC